MTMIGSPWDVETGTEWSAEQPQRPEWFDELVELHVLSAHGDDHAARDMAQWSAQDPQVALFSTQLHATHRSISGD
ncbi:hypothetical protein [Actinomycetospora sp. TBRC 11914]|uniref:hypothetical protein n=1 Tax=Actinomycetospora sp. TBRC 11914 TaxID=2729387 RepID=UPI00145C610F|nr:hypothetical protein [Actinomycetospora sp. TBRC 11914]NMO92990.1 hypothetical protein [Actinomycetospora sp. TBRC 11914]